MRFMQRQILVGLTSGLVLCAGAAAAQDDVQDGATGACGQPSALISQRLVLDTQPTEVVGAFVDIQRREPRYIEIEVKERMALTLATLASIDTTLILFDANGQILASDDDSGDNSNARIVTLLEPGSYCAQAGIYGGLNEPAGIVPVAISKAPSGDACILQADAPHAMKPEDEEVTRAGVLDVAVRQAVTLAPGTGLTIAARSPMFDTYLTLQDELGREVMTDDDGGDGTNSRMDINPVQEETTYCVALTALDDERGVYSLLLSPFGVGATMPAQDAAVDAVEDAARDAPVSIDQAVQNALDAAEAAVQDAQ